jgi:hypothetical protein
MEDPGVMNMVLDVELIGEEDIKVKGGIEKKRKGYKKYSDAVDRIHLVSWIKEEIEKKSEKTIVVKVDDVAKEMGPEFVNAGYQIMYQALKAILFQKGIFLSMATHKDGDKTFLLRYIKEGDKLAPSYLFVKHRIKQEEMLEIEEQGQKEKEKKERRDIKTTDIGIGVESRRERIIKEKLAIQEEKEKERQERIAMHEEIRKLKEILHGRLGKKSCMIEIYQFNWNTLTWRMIKRSSVRTYLKLLEVVTDNTSTTENRYRIEFTPLYQLENMEKDLPEDEDLDEYENRADNIEKEGVKDEVKGEEKGDVHGIEVTDLAEVSDTLEELRSREEKAEKVEDIEGVEKVEQVQEKKEGELECPRCGGKNIKTWSTVQVIKTRSGDRKLRHRCADCNETFSDEDLGINM